MAFTQNELQISVSTPLGKDKLLLERMEGEEQVSGLFRFHLEMKSEDRALDFAAIVGKGATITLELPDDKKRYVHGIVTRFSQASAQSRFATYFAEIRPWLWLLSKTADCRIFQQKSAPDIIQQIFDDAGFTDYEVSLTGTYVVREYCVQYHETALAFVSRLMEDEGIHYYFKHEDGKHTLVLSDDSASAPVCPGSGSARYGDFDLASEQDAVVAATLEESVITGKAEVDDYNFETPSTKLLASVDSTVGDNAGKRPIYEYATGYLKKADGDTKAKVRIEAFEVPAKGLAGEGNARAFTTGHKFTLKEHYRSDANADYLLTRVMHSAGENGYVNTYEAIPLDTPFRPQRLTPEPRIAGTQTAKVVGKSGEEIWTDKYGRIKVQFHWDREGKNDENSSCWIRVAHNWAGKSWGQIFLPRIGMEVVVSFLEGDPDRPLVTGNVYNAEQTVPYALPGEQTKSTIKSNSSKGGGGFNELRLEDKKGEEEVFLHAQKDYNVVVENNEVDLVRKNRTTYVMDGEPVEDEGTRDRLVVDGKRWVTVKRSDAEELHENEGNFTHTVAGDYSLTVEGNMVVEVKGDLTIKGKSVLMQSTQNDVTVKSAANLTTQATKNLTDKAGSALTSQAGTSLTNKAGTSLTNQSGTDLTNKAGTSMTNQASISLTNKGSATQTVDGGGMLTLKGGLVKIN